MKKSIKKSIKPLRTLQRKTRKKTMKEKTIHQLLDEIDQLLDEASEIYPQYSTNSKKGLHMKNIIRKLNKKLHLTKKAYSNLSKKLEQHKYNSKRSMILDNIEQKSGLIKLREEIYIEQEDIARSIKVIEEHIKGLTNAINQIKQQQENNHIAMLVNGKGQYVKSRIGNVLALRKGKTPFRF